MLKVIKLHVKYSKQKKIKKIQSNVALATIYSLLYFACKNECFLVEKSQWLWEEPFSEEFLEVLLAISLNTLFNTGKQWWIF